MHKPVLLKEVIDNLHIIKNGKYIDATVGTGGHSSEILIRGGKLLGIDADSQMIVIARKKLEEACPPADSVGGKSFKLVKGNFRDIKNIAQKNGFSKVNGILIDLGISSLHYEFDRGFSFGEKGSLLDMRIEPDIVSVKASDLLNALNEKSLQKMFSVTMPDVFAKSLSKKVVIARKSKQFANVEDFVNLFPKRTKKIHPATKAFLALRIAVNNEFESLEKAIDESVSLLGSGARLLIITFHSTEDRIVKNKFLKLEEDKVVKKINKKPIVPGSDELMLNKRSRSAKLRIIEKL